MRLTVRYLSFIFLLLLSGAVSAQRIGVVLSGGGAKAAAHIGFLKALEENEIPIDYITGSSMGAVVGGMYASGLSIHQIDSIVRSEEYIRMAEGDIDDELRFFFKEEAPSASMGTIKFTRGKLSTPSLPINLINTALLDFNFMLGFSQASAASNYNFDSLMIPFRCVASDIERKKQVVFNSGHLSSAIRASMTYPFYLEPITLDGQLLFDGGLYNNFPSDVLYNDFLPDLILGCNVSSNEDSPSADDLLSQLKSMVVYETNFETLCEEMVIVEPNLDIGTFDFQDVGKAIDAGYAAALLQIDSIKSICDRRVTPAQVAKQRADFNSKKTKLVFDEITVSGLERSQKAYVRKFMRRRADTLEVPDLKKKYFRICSDDKIRTVFPTATYKQQTGLYSLNMNMKKEKDILLSFGGNVSSRPLNVGYVGLRYNIFGRVSTTLHANSYFGKFYGSTHVAARFDFPFRIPMSIEPSFTINRWDYFRSFATFFEEVNPSFIVSTERFASLGLRLPVNNKGRLDLIANTARIADDYYQNESFSASDTADRTRFDAVIFDALYERNTLNRKLYANRGTHFFIRGKNTLGQEQTIPGSTSINKDTVETARHWVNLKLSYQNYFYHKGPFSVGFLAEGVYSDQPSFQNATASRIALPAFQPIPESASFFLNQFRAQSYGAGGVMLVTSFTPNFEMRLEGYAFAGIGNTDATAEGIPFFEFQIDPVYMGSGALVLHSPIGPLSLTANYYDLKEDKWSFVFNFGYLIFNRSVRHN